MNVNSFDTTEVEDAIRNLLLAVGENPEREGLADTPKRVAKFWLEFLGNKKIQEDKSNTVFQTNLNGTVIVSGIRVYSLCEHHLMPFWADITIGYNPEGKVLGLSKFARIADGKASSLQTQENLVNEILAYVKDVTESRDVFVLGTGVHTCMIARGIKRDGKMTTIASSGVYSDINKIHNVVSLIG